MIDNLKSQEELEVKKLKVTKADIVVKGNVDKPYYVIVYHEVGKDYDHEGFASYYLENVFKWRNEELEIVDEKEQPKTDWIPCEERLPSESGTYLVTDKVFNGENIRYETDTAYFNGETWHSDFEGIYNGRTDIGRRVIAWSNLPQPYKKEGAENE